MAMIVEDGRMSEAEKGKNTRMDWMRFQCVVMNVRESSAPNTVAFKSQVEFTYVVSIISLGTSI
jgi:hypothetical protein